MLRSYTDGREDKEGKGLAQQHRAAQLGTGPRLLIPLPVTAQGLRQMALPLKVSSGKNQVPLLYPVRRRSLLFSALITVGNFVLFPSQTAD